MNDQTVIRSLKAIEQTYDRIIDPSTKHLLAGARSQVESSYRYYQSVKKRKDVPEEQKRWGYEISPRAPLVFLSSAVHDLEMTADVYCKLAWEEGDVPVEQDIKVRVWTRHEDTMFREEWDAPTVKDKLDSLRPSIPFRGRMVARWHFDRVSPGAGASGRECHPTFHLQYGGTGTAANQEVELSWHPEKINIPRVPCAPMDLALACQLVAANFHFPAYLTDRTKPEWLGGVKPMENALLLGYYSECISAIQSRGKTLLDELCDL